MAIIATRLNHLFAYCQDGLDSFLTLICKILIKIYIFCLFG